MDAAQVHREMTEFVARQVDALVVDAVADTDLRLSVLDGLLINAVTTCAQAATYHWLLDNHMLVPLGPGQSDRREGDDG